MGLPGARGSSRGLASLATLAWLTLLGFGLGGTPRPAAAQQVGLPLGTRPDAVVLQDLAGHDVDLADYIGSRPVLLEFWATWCPLCRAMEPRLRAARERYGDGVAFLIVAVGVNQNPRRIRRFLEHDSLPGRVLWDGDGAATRAFDAPSTSYIVILDRAGKVVYTGIGEDQELGEGLERAVGR